MVKRALCDENGIRIKGRSLLFAVMVLVLLLGGGCATSIVSNKRLDHFDPTQGYRARNLGPGEHNSDSLLVVLTFSGGGTRAASFAYGVLEQLRDTPITWEGEERSLLDEVDVISSVSGGSLPAAYYGLFGERIFDDFPGKVLYTNIQGNLIRRILLPPDNIKMMSPLFTRTDILAGNFDRYIFEGQTFADLLKAGHRPYIIINATDLAKKTRFEFTQDQFDHLYSDLGPYHVGHAVAASACFPGVFPPMTVHNFERGADYRMPDWAEEVLAQNAIDTMAYAQAASFNSYGEPDRPYIHLSDGGVADNLGLMPVIQLLRRETEGYGPAGGGLYAKAKTILIVTVNSEVKAPRAWDMVQSPVGLIQTLLSAGTTPLSNFTAAQMAYLRLLIENRELRAELNRSEGRGAGEHNPEIHFVEVSFARAKDPEQRDRLNAVPTSFALKCGQVSELRTAAAEILREHPQFQAFLKSLDSEEE